MKGAATMMLQRSWHLSLLFQVGAYYYYPAPASASSDREIKGIASAGNYIHIHEDVDLSSTGYRSKIEIKSDVPVTVQRYSDNQFSMGQQPVPDNIAMVFVTSDCDTSESELVPNISLSSGSISVTLGANKEDAPAMPFLEPSSYSALWIHGNDCFNPELIGQPPVDILPPVTVKPITGDLPPIIVTQQSCNPDVPCVEEGSTCGRGTEACCGVTHEEIQCRCRLTSDGSLRYSCSNTEACMFPSCCRSGSPAGKPGPSHGTCSPGSLCDTEVEDDYCCTDMQGLGTFCSKSGGSAVASPIDTTPSECECEVGPSGDPAVACGEGKFCQLAVGACSQASQSGNRCGKCAFRPASCTEEYDPVCGCDGETYSNECNAHSVGTSVSFVGGECKADTAPGDPEFIEGSADECEVGPAANTAMTCGRGEFCQLDLGVCNNKSGIHVGACAATGCACTTMQDPVCGCDQKTYSNECSAHSAGVSVSRMGECDATPGATGETASTTLATGSPIKDATTSVATTVAGTTAGTTTTSVSTTGTTNATSFAVDADFPTSETSSTKPSSNEVPNPSPEEEDPDNFSNRSGAFNLSRSFAFCLSTMFMAVIVTPAIFPGVGENNNLWGFGKFAVAALAVSSHYPKTSPATNDSIKRKSNGHGSKSFAAQSERTLQTCTYNIEILIDGCNHPLEIFAPAGRVVDVVIEDVVSKDLPDCVTEFGATLNFSLTDEAMVMNLEDGGTVSTLDQLGGTQCIKAVMGRPFVDATGDSLQAMPWTHDNKLGSTISELSWTGEASVGTRTSPMSNVTNPGRVLLGEDWIQRALGEHASIASFSAFSIALMSNGAPAALVDDALKAGLDEIRHARTSFNIASKLTEREVGPGPLPESKLEFGQDLKTLALAVAREGCVDETLSAFAAAVEVKHITEVLANEVQDTPYINVDRDLLALIRNELVAIAMDESNHSALAWRTLKWVCSVDSNVCEAVQTDVFAESNLKMRLNQRADRSFGEMSWVLHSMRGEWKKIFNAHQLASSGLKDESLCEDAVQTKEGKSLLTSVAENVLLQVYCG